MTEIKAFQGIHYNPAKITNPSKVMCPPYDVISATQQEGYYTRNEYNFIRLEHAKDKAGDNDQSNKYTRAKDLLNQWLESGVLVQDEKPSIYYYRQEYKVQGERHSRLGFLAVMKIQDEKNSKIFPHENTHAAAKEDRFKLWTSVGANLSPIFVCFSDRERKVEKIFITHLAVTKPLFDVTDDDGVKHLFWKLDDAKLVGQIVASLANQSLFIADGHHRYEVACEIRRQKLAQIAKPTGEEPFNYVMTYFTNIDSKDLKIFPMHRIVTKLPGQLSFLEEYFRMDRIKAKNDFMVLLAKAGQNEHAFGLYTKEGYMLLRLKNKSLIDKTIKEGSKEYRRLDATILKYFVFDKLGVKSEDIIYTKDSLEVITKVDEGVAEAGFIMNPVKISQLKAVALNGEKMPPKTTYFYPKVLSGLTTHRII